MLERATGLDRSLYRLPVLMLDDFSQITPELIRQVRKHYATRKGLIERERERDRKSDRKEKRRKVRMEELKEGRQDILRKGIKLNSHQLIYFKF